MISHVIMLQHAVVVVEGSKREWYVPILSIVDKSLVRVNAMVLVKAGGLFKNVPLAIVGVVHDGVDSKATVYKLERAPKVCCVASFIFRCVYVIAGII